MKINVSEAELAEHQRRTIIGGAKGLFGGIAIATPIAFYANKRFTHYRSLSPGLKAFSVITFVVPACVIWAERAGLEYEKEQWTGTGKDEMDLVQRRELERWNSLSTGEKARDFAERHQYGIIGGAWAASLAGSFGYIMREPTQSFSQKIVQARMWAQGLTIGILIAAGAVASVNKARVEPWQKRGVDHSWKDIIALEEAQKKQQVAQ